MKNTFGSIIQYTLLGESHGDAIGIVIDGLPAGITLDFDLIQSQMEKRKAKGKISTMRHEADTLQIVSGYWNHHTTGTPLTILIANQDTRSKDYERTSYLARPSHADYSAHVKYHGYEDYRGGGHFSGRLTAPIVAVSYTHLLRLPPGFFLRIIGMTLIIIKTMVINTTTNVEIALILGLTRLLIV